MRAVLGLLVGGALASAAAGEHHGKLVVLDAQTVRVDGVVIQLFGVAALASDARCGREAARSWPCGAWGAAEARARYDGRLAQCVLFGNAVPAADSGAAIGLCTVAGDDLGAALVKGGLAFADPAESQAYVPLERRAAARGAGFHAVGVRAVGPERAPRLRAPGTPTVWRPGGGAAAIKVLDVSLGGAGGWLALGRGD